MFTVVRAAIAVSGLLLSLANAAPTGQSVGCARFHTIESGDTCYDITLSNNITLLELLSFNHGVQCDALEVGEQLCVASKPRSIPKTKTLKLSNKTTLFPTPTDDTIQDPNANTSAVDCETFHVVSPGDTCYLLARKYDLTWVEFRTANPDIQCDNLQLGEQVCIQEKVNSTATLTEAAFPTQAGEADASTVSCGRFRTVLPGDTCFEIAQMQSMTLSEFLSINPDVQCNALKVGEILCVEILEPAESLTATATAAPTATDSTDAGTSSVPCGRFHTIVPGDTCFDIAQNASITWIELERINPGIQCERLRLGEEICTDMTLVSMLPPQTLDSSFSCTDFYTIVAGDTCLSIAQSAGISWIEFRAKNIGVQCGSLKVGDRLCVR